MNKHTHRKGAAGPTVISMTRRDFLRLTGVAMAATGASSLPAYAADVHGEESQPQKTPTTSVLPKNPTRNPGFNARRLPDQGLVVWARRSDRGLVAYELNSDGHCIWRLCDGTREPAQIAAEYEKCTHRPGHEADVFLAELLKLGVVASGAKVVAVDTAPAKG